MQKRELLKALETVKPGLSSSEAIEQTTNFAFIEGRVVTYNDEISISHPVEGLDITGAVKATELYELLRKIKQDEIEISVTDTEIIVQAGKTKAGLLLAKEIKLPLEEISGKGKWKPIPEDFLKAVRMAMYSCSTNSNEPVLTCVHINASGFVEGSDNFRIIRHELASELPTKTFLIPSKSAAEVVKLQPTKIAEGESWIHFKTPENTIISCRIFEESFPVTDKFFNVTGDDLKFPTTINDILDRASVFTKGKGVLEEEVDITLSTKKIKIRSNSDTGWFEEEANVKYEGDTIEIKITPALLKDILRETQNCIYSGKFLKFTGESWQYVVVLRISEKK